jgi:hypothetical protein
MAGQEVHLWEYWERFGWFQFASPAKKCLLGNIGSDFRLIHFTSPGVRTISMMLAFTASGSSGHRSMIDCRLGSMEAICAPTAVPGAALS